MAKLTAEEKAANREVHKARDRAYNSRRKLYRTAADNALAEFDATSPEAKEMEVANGAFNETLDTIKAERAAIEEQIRALREQEAGLNAKHHLDEVADRRRNAVDARNKARSALQARIDSEFSDVAGIFSAVQWAANGHFQPEAPVTA